MENLKSTLQIRLHALFNASECPTCGGEHRYSKPPPECWERRVRFRDKGLIPL